MNLLMKKKKILIIPLFLLLLLAFAGLGLYNLPWLKKLKMHLTGDKGSQITLANQPFPSHILYNDFEVDPKTGNQDGLYKGIAHSGIFSVKAFGSNSFSRSVEKPVDGIGLENLSAVALSAWIYIFPGNTKPDATLVFVVTNNRGVDTCWKGISFNGEGIPMGKWFKISGSFDLSGSHFQHGNKVKIYLWNCSHTDMLADDIYAVFGGMPARAGDTVHVDMTRDIPFVPGFNEPPFPFWNLKKDEIHNRDVAALINRDGLKQGTINRDDRVMAGRFTGNKDGLDDILIIHPGGKPELFSFDREHGVFRQFSIEIPKPLTSFFETKMILPGNFTGQANKELLFAGEQQSMLGSFEKIDNSADPRYRFKVIWQGENKNTGGLGPVSGRSLAVGDFDGDNSSELLIISAGGIYQLLRFKMGPVREWISIINRDKEVPDEWKLPEPSRSLNAGRFVAAVSRDVILTVSKTSQGHYAWSLRKFDPGSGLFNSCFVSKPENRGKIIGMDTLKPADQFFPGITSPNGEPCFMRYNRDWRFDLKYMRFNDTTYQVMASADFQGYESSRNPKYYEWLKILAGKLVKPGITSILVMAGNNSEIKDLPRTIQVYSGESNLKSEVH